MSSLATIVEHACLQPFLRRLREYDGSTMVSLTRLIGWLSNNVDPAAYVVWDPTSTRQPNCTKR